MTTGFLLPDGRDFSSVFSAGDAGLTTGFSTAYGTDLGRQFVAGNSGVVTGYKDRSGIDLGSRFGIRTSWTNPHITERGTLGGATFAVSSTGDTGGNWSGSENWKAFDGNTATKYFDRCGSAAAENYITLTMYSPKPVLLTSISILPSGYGLRSAILQYSADGVSFKDLISISTPNNVKTETPINSPGYYKYWKLRRMGYGNNYGGWRDVEIAEIVLKGYVIK